MANDDSLQALPDGTVKQRNPFTGTEVWTVPGRANRPLSQPRADAVELSPGDEGHWCAFCVDRLAETPPERTRLVEHAGLLVERRDLPPAQALSGAPLMRRIPNLFEILPLDYWQQNHGASVPAVLVERMEAYLADPDGRAHIESLAKTWARASGRPEPSDEQGLRRLALGWFGSGHEVVVPRRHFIEGATNSSQLASSGALGVAGHRDYFAFVVRAIRDLYTWNSSARYVATFQNWLKPAGASFDHLHKQVVAIDEWGPHVTDMARAIAADREAPTVLGLELARRHGLLLASNDHAVAWVGIGHRYPTVEVWSRHAGRPWQMDESQVAGMADLVHAVHAATGAEVPCNEEWMHRPPDCEQAIVWRVLVKWRISTLAGFEGATRVYLNTLAPRLMRERLLARLTELAEHGEVAPLRLGDEVDVARVGG